MPIEQETSSPSDEAGSPQPNAAGSQASNPGLKAWLARHLPFGAWLKRLDARVRPLLQRHGGNAVRRAREMPGLVRREVAQRGTSPRAWLGEPHDWINIRRKRVWVVAALLTYTLAGFFLAPWILRREIVAAVQKTIDRPVALDGLRINPFALSADFRGLRITEKDGAPLTGFDRLYIRFQLLSPLRWAWCFDEVKLEGMKSDVVRYTVTDTNIARLLQSLKSPSAKPEKDQGLPRLVIDRLEIKGTSATFIDHVPAKLFQTTIGPVYIKLNRLSTLAKKQGKQHAYIESEGGAQVEWTGTFGLNPIASAGHISSKGLYAPVLTRYFEDVLKFSAPKGHSKSDLDYQLQTKSDGTLALTVKNLDFVLSDVALHQSSAQSPFLVLPELHLAGGHMTWPENVVGADSLTIDGLNLTAQRQQDGQFNLAQLLPAGKKTEAPAAPQQTSPAPAWSFALGKFEIKNAKARLDDHALREPGAVDVTSFSLEADNLSNKQGAAFPLTVAMGVAPGGQIKLQSQVSVLPQVKIDAKLAISDLQIAAIQPYLHDIAHLKIDGGRLNFETDLKMDDPQKLNASGHGEVLGLKLIDEVENTPVLSWDRVGLDQYSYDKAANALQISQVTIGAPFIRFLVAKDRSTNFSHVMIAKGGDKASSAPDAQQSAQSAAPEKETAPAPDNTAPAASSSMNISVGKITVAKGSADYGDESLPLPFAAHITDLQGDVTTLSTATTEPASLNLHGQVGEFGEVKVDGALTPFDPTRSTKIDILFRNVEFPGLSPYTVKFAGQRIANGRLDVSLKYAIDKGKMEGSNRVVIRNIELGEKVNVPGATNLPLGLAIAVLKDREGKIDVDLPVSGDVKDPKFALGGVIWKAIFNLLTNIITSPFQALAGLAGGDGAKLDHIDFDPGSAALSPPEKEKIAQLAKALNMRPSLALAIPGAVDPDTDRFKLQLDAVDAQMAQKLGEKNTLERQRKFLVSLFKDKIGKEQIDPLEQQFMRTPEGQPNASPVLDEAAYVAALRERVAKVEPIGDAELEKLAQARAAAVADALKLVPGLNPKRVSVQASAKVKADSDGAIPLKLNATTLNSGG